MNEAGRLEERRLDAEDILAKKKTERRFDAEAHSLLEDGWQLIIPNLPLDPVFGFLQGPKL